MSNFRDTTYYPYYGHMSPNERSLYEQLLHGFLACDGKITVTVPAVFRQVSEVINAIYYDHPEIFWMTQKAVITQNSASGAVIAVSPEYLFAPAGIPGMKRKFQSAVQRYLAAAAGKKLLDQERILHDKLAGEVSYVHGPCDQTAYSALVEGKSVCAGYTRAFQLLMQEIGIPCYYCQGEGKSPLDRKWESHAWNILKLGSEYYNMDLTWDDCYDKTQPGRISYTYYNCDDTKIAADHKRAAACSFLPACRGTACSFKGIAGIEPELEGVYRDGVTCRRVIRSSADFSQCVLPEIRRNRGRTTGISFPVEGTQNYTRLKEQITDSIKAELSDMLYRIEYRYTDYKNGWYRIEIAITYDDPLQRIYADGVACRQVIRSSGDFERYILPEIRRCAGRTTTVSFPVEVQGTFETFQQTMSNSIRGLFKNRSFRWNGSWRHYGGNWYWMQYKIEYK